MQSGLRSLALVYLSGSQFHPLMLLSSLWWRLASQHAQLFPHPTASGISVLGCSPDSSITETTINSHQLFIWCPHLLKVPQHLYHFILPRFVYMSMSLPLGYSGIKACVASIFSLPGPTRVPGIGYTLCTDVQSK